MYEKGATAFAPLNRSGRFHACRAAHVRNQFAALLSSNGVVPWQQNISLLLCYQSLSKRF